ncbi:MAG TPA: ferritin [Nitriliruptoraceae bacterium]|nr:ferritin [Nitriliruptoraceae bacterium]
MDDALLTLFNDQIALEQSASRSYRQMAAWADANDYSGTAAWMLAQSVEETAHADIFIEFVLDRDQEVVLQALDAPRPTYDGLVDVFATALAQEQSVTESIGQLYKAAQDANDFRSLPLLNKFLQEQVEEEASVSTVLGELRMVEGNPTATLMLDRELPGRRGGASPTG